MTLLPMPEDEGSIIPVCGMTCIPALRRVAHVGKTDSVNTQKLSSQIGVGIGIAIGIENGISSEPDSDSDTDPECCATAGQIPPSRMFFRSVPPPAAWGGRRVGGRGTRVCFRASVPSAAAPVCPCWKNRSCRLVIVIVIVIEILIDDSIFSITIRIAITSWRESLS